MAYPANLTGWTSDHSGTPTRQIILDLDPLQAWANVIENLLGLTPQGAAATVRARLDALDTVIPINQQTGTTYTAVLADAGKIIQCTNGALVTVTVPASVFAGSTTASNFFEVYANGAAGVSLIAGAGLTMRPGSPQPISQWTSRRVRFISATECVVE